MLNNGIIYSYTLLVLFYGLVVFAWAIWMVTRLSINFVEVNPFIHRFLQILLVSAFTLLFTSGCHTYFILLSFVLLVVFFSLVNNVFLSCCVWFTFTIVYLLTNVGAESFINTFIAFEVVFLSSFIAPLVSTHTSKSNSSAWLFLLSVLNWNLASTSLGVLILSLLVLITGSSNLAYFYWFNYNAVGLTELSFVYVSLNMSFWAFIFLNHSFYNTASLGLITFFNICYFWFFQWFLLNFNLLFTGIVNYYVILLVFGMSTFLINLVNHPRDHNSFILLTSLITYLSLLPLLFFS